MALFGRIVACVDSSPDGQQACRVATEVAVRFSSRLTLLTVLPWSGKDAQPDLERLIPMDPTGRPIHRMLEDAQAEAMKKGVPSTELVYLRGKVVESMMDYLNRAPPDLVVVGTRGLSRGSRLLLGSVSGRLVTEAPCTVLVVRSPRRGAAK
jgi:nucleotide-binding universal stress UspA family protein